MSIIHNFDLGDLTKKEAECRELGDQAKRNSETIEYLNKACNEKQMEIKPLGATGVGGYGVGAYSSAPTSTYTRAVPIPSLTKPNNNLLNESSFSFTPLVKLLLLSNLLMILNFEFLKKNIFV